jgi:AraC-like DNA-binding protein
MSEEFGYPCAFALATHCQKLVCELFEDPAALELGALGHRFAAMPRATRYNDAAVAASILAQFTATLGKLIHGSLHPARTSACEFQSVLYTTTLPVCLTDPSAWNPAEAVALWAERFGEGLARTHDLVAERTRAQLLRNPAQRIGLSELARDAAASASVLCRRFVSRVGETPLRYRTRRRVIAAIPLLRQGLKIDAVAAEVGWKTRKDLYRALRAVAGVTPAQIRALRDSEAGELLIRVGRHVPSRRHLLATIPGCASL